MRKMFLVSALVMIWSAALLAVPTFTPTIDGTKDAEWGITPDHSSTTCMQPTEFNLDGGLYVTDDGTNIYFGFDADPDPWGDGASIHCHILIDVGETVAGGHYDQWGSSVTYDQPYLPDYEIITQWNTDNPSLGWTALETWNGSNWVQSQLVSPMAGGGGSWTEITLQKGLIGAPGEGEVLNLSMWLRPEWSKVNGNCCLPEDADFPTDWADAPAGNFSTQFSYTIQTALADSDPPGIDHVRQIDPTGLEIVFDEPMNQDSLSRSAYYVPTGWTFTGFRYITATTVGMSAAPPGFTSGVNYTIELTPGIVDLADNSIDTEADSATWTGVGYANVTFTCIDQSQTHDQIFLKGSWNFYHEYDASWSWGHHQMYDDGTNGDPTAGDHEFTIVFPLVPNGGTPNFEWGLEDENYSWLIEGGNPSFTLPDVNPLAVDYTIPGGTSQAVDVTFHVSMKYIDASIEVMRIAGGFTSWDGGNSDFDMSDPDMDDVWDITVTFPAASQYNQEFKFIRIHDGGQQDWEFISNRTFEIDDAGSTQDLGVLFFNDYIPYQLTAEREGSDVRLRWNGDFNVDSFFDVYASLDPDNIVDPLNLLDTVNDTTYLDIAPGDEIKFYQVETTLPPE